MARRSVQPLAVARWSVLLIAAAVACESSTGISESSGRRVAVGDTISGTVHGDTVPTYSFIGQSGGQYAVFFQVTSGSAALAVSDSASGAPLGAVFDSPISTGGFDTRATGNFPGIGVALISVVGDPNTQFRFLVYRVNRAPELRPARFTIGDTVSGEALGSIADVDDFVAAGLAGQDLIGWIEGLSPEAAGVSVLVSAALDSSPIGFAYDGFGQIPRQVFAVAPLPATQDYHFTVPVTRAHGSLPSTGPYRFRFYAIDRAPEIVPAAILTNTVVAGETIGIAGDIDEFTFSASAGQEFNAFIQSTAARPIFLVPFGTIEAGSIAGSAPADTGLFRHGTGRFKILTAGGHGLRVSGELVSDATGPYRVYLYPINRAPELTAAAVTPGDTVVGETIELPGDIDEFTFAGVSGDEFNAFLEADSAASPGGVTLDVIDPADGLIANTQVLSPGPDLLNTSTGRFALALSGTYRLRISGSTGPYKVFLYKVDRHPETAPDTLVFGDSLATESIDVPGDIDEFVVSVSDTSGSNVLVEVDASASAGAVNATLVNAVTGEPVSQSALSAPGIAGQSSTTIVGPGAYLLRVLGGAYYEERTALRGAYRVWLYAFRLGPETASDTMVIGDTVTENSEPLGDVDNFAFYALRRQHVAMAVQGMAPASSGGFTVVLGAPGSAPFAGVSSPASSPSLDDNRSPRIDIPATGWYRLTVLHPALPPVPGERAPYRLALEPWSIAPEHVGDSLAPGDSVIDEVLDYAGDWDEFVISAAPGSEAAVLLRRLGTNGYPRALIFDPTTGDSLSGVAGASTDIGAGPFSIPAGGQVRVAVREGPGSEAYTGGYILTVVQVNRQPEVASATLVVGDTVRGESLSPEADIDEFTGSGSPGETLSPWLRLLADPSPSGRFVKVEVVDPASGIVLVGANAGFPHATPGFVSPGSFTVPSTGTFLIRVRAGILFPEEVATAPYELFVKR